MKIQPSGNNRNMMRLRQTYYNTIISQVESIHAQTWNKLCYDILEEHNELLESDHIAFKYLGEMYPPEVVRNTRSALLNRKSSELAEELREEFEMLHKDLVENWDKTYRSFKNLLSTLFREAKDPLQIEEFLPEQIVDKLEALDFIPLPKAPGINKERKAELKEEYKEAFAISRYLTVGQLL